MRQKEKLQPLLGARPYETWPSGVESNVEYDEVSEFISAVAEERRASSPQSCRKLLFPCWKQTGPGGSY